MTETRSPDLIRGAYATAEKVFFNCEDHLYTGIGSKIPPIEGCKSCEMASLWSIWARQSGDKQEALEKMEALFRALCECDDEGLFDYQTTPIQVSIEKDCA